MSKSYDNGVRDARSGRKDPLGGFNYSLGHADEEARLKEEDRKRLQRPAPPFELPNWVRTISKWTGALGFVCGAAGGFVIANSALTLPQSIAVAAFAGLVGLGVGFLIPIVVTAAVVLMLETALTLAIFALILLAIGVIALLIYAAVTYLSS